MNSINASASHKFYLLDTVVAEGAFKGILDRLSRFGSNANFT